MKKVLLSTTIALSLTTSANADFIGAEIGYAAWNSSLTGNIKKGNDSLDFEKDLGYGSSEINGFIWLYIDHPLPLLPNIKIQKTNFSDKGNGTISKSVTFDDKEFFAADSASSSLTLNQVDVIPYWRILDNWINLDVGLNIKSIDGKIEIDTNTEHASENFNLVLPMLYTKVKFDLPFTGFSVEADASYIKYEDNSFSDIKAGIVYETSFGLGAIAGYKKQNITLDDVDDIYGTLNTKGAYLGLFYHF